SRRGCAPTPWNLPAAALRTRVCCAHRRHPTLGDRPGRCDRRGQSSPPPWSLPEASCESGWELSGEPEGEPESLWPLEPEVEPPLELEMDDPLPDDGPPEEPPWSSADGLSEGWSSLPPCFPGLSIGSGDSRPDWRSTSEWMANEVVFPRSFPASANAPSDNAPAISSPATPHAMTISARFTISA